MLDQKWSQVIAGLPIYIVSGDAERLHEVGLWHCPPLDDASPVRTVSISD
ncbi:MAG: hypothetical protein OXE78_04580 [Gammaproteobacteria bacterium]|nr:hypothetical protein [Gammaproteobacteria bacterium]MCY4356073.1 hypothetical protein [Gammaproteobacteria bacterium]